MEGSVGSAVPAVQGAGYGCGSLLIRRFAQVIIRPCGVVVGRGIVRVKLDGHGEVVEGIGIGQIDCNSIPVRCNKQHLVLAGWPW